MSGKEAATETPDPPPESVDTSIEVVAAETRKLSDGMLAAARAGDAAEIRRLVLLSFTPPFPQRFSAAEATKLLDGLVRSRELAAFTTLADQLKETNNGQGQRISDEPLASLVKRQQKAGTRLKTFTLAVC